MMKFYPSSSNIDPTFRRDALAQLGWVEQAKAEQHQQTSELSNQRRPTSNSKAEKLKTNNNIQD